MKALALISGGLDSILAVEVLRNQGIEVLGITFETPFFSPDRARAAAHAIGLSLLVHDIADAHLTMLRAPRYGFGKNMNPCIDCHTLMLRKAGDKLVECGAEFLATGEVLGQRPMSQTRQSLYVVAKNSGYQDLIVRPLSARLLPETKPEREGKVDRMRLLDIQGRGRKRQFLLAEHYGITSYPPPAGGCLLTDPMFSRRLRDLFSHQRDFTLRDIELLKVGRHFRPTDDIKIIVGRNNGDNVMIESLAGLSDCVLRTAGHPGPTVMIPGGGTRDARIHAASLCVLYSDAPNDQEIQVDVSVGDKSSSMTAKASSKDDAKRWII
ncbi:MAG: tRNA 4-thiouridine(8) synthase ThiI [Smithellaceae bacterium]|nr:tRNA 4-thiouridine(8) synthase ThiI [Smithellaceae bacterium]